MDDGDGRTAPSAVYPSPQLCLPSCLQFRPDVKIFNLRVLIFSCASKQGRSGEPSLWDEGKQSKLQLQMSPLTCGFGVAHLERSSGYRVAYALMPGGGDLLEVGTLAPDNPPLTPGTCGARKALRRRSLSTVLSLQLLYCGHVGEQRSTTDSDGYRLLRPAALSLSYTCSPVLQTGFQHV